MPNNWLMSQPNLDAAVENFRAAIGKDGPIKPYLDYANQDPYMAVWLYQVNRRCSQLYGISIFDLGDSLWRDKFDADMSPTDALQEAMEEDDMGSMMLADLESLE